MLNGNFFSELWGHNAADIDVRTLIHEYPIISWTNEGNYQINTIVVRSLQTTTAANGDRTYTVTLNPGLRYCDGTPITARDYVFSFLLMSSPQVAALAGITSAKTYLEGYAAYQSGESNIFTGIRLLSNLSFSVKVTAENLPYYFELNYVNTNPLPYQVLAPGCDIADDGRGAYIQGEFTADTLRETLLNEETGYLSHPAVTSGPYKLLSYNSQTHEALLEINPNYLGNYEGQVPTVPRLLLRQIKNENIISELVGGSVDLVNKVTEGNVTDASIVLAANGTIGSVSYPRSGAGFLAIASERQIPSSVLMRQALAYLVDYDVLPREFLNGHGERVYGYYGLGQWMAQERTAELTRMQAYHLDTVQAAKLLKEDGWIYNAQGGAYQQAPGNLRYKRFSDELKPLVLVMAITDDNNAADILAAMLNTNLQQVGGQLQTVNIPFDQALRQYYRQESRQFDLMLLGTNFSYLFDPTANYMVGDEYQGTMNTSGVQDARLEDLAEKITADQPGNRNAYLNRWMDFQRYWSEVLPMIPLYSNTYYDLYVPELLGYYPQFYWSWGTAILYASLNR